VRRRLVVLVVLVALTGCLPGDPYPVVAVADLRPLGARITGPVEVLGTSSPIPERDIASRTLAAYRVDLPDLAPRRARIYDAPGCDEPVGEPHIVADLQQIRRVGEEAHFFVLDIPVGDRELVVDTGTIAAAISMDPTRDNYVIGKIAVVQALDREDGTPGEWLACGVFGDPGLLDP
jgi:hypothetical protein